MSELPNWGPTSVTITYAVSPTKAMSVGPPNPMIDWGRPLANVVTSPVSGSTREIRPTAPSVTYSAPSGPTVLPDAPSSPVTSLVGTDWAAAGAGQAAVTRRSPSIVTIFEFIGASLLCRQTARNTA